MNRPLFVHTDPRILDRLTQESNGAAMVTTSMVQALQWITNPELTLSGVFLSPDDTTFSAFRFLEVTLTHRPALPIFLFESKLSAHHDVGQRVMKNTHVRGIFSGTEPYQTLVASIQVNVAAAHERKKAPEAVQKQGYLALPISDFFTGSKYPYNIFVVEPPNNMNLFAQKDAPIDAAYLNKAAAQTQYLYVKEEDIQKNKTELKDAQSQFLESNDYPTNWKIAETMVTARNVLSEMKNAGMNEQLVEYTQGMLGDLFKLISRIDSDEGSLFNMIDKAKTCDRSVFCASYSMLVCKQLRFEKTATLEILGLASVLQDISLYRTPFGDLSEKIQRDLSPEQLAYYLKHPTLSADMVAHHTDVPQVTLQVVRQHHERKDKSGFPNRVGGNQLHPMAEILSLINSYYELSKAYTDDTQIILELQKMVFPHYSENVVVAFKQVLGNILKDKSKALA
jgi:response regulator RpfG family c-di-GMP phosphodiesterase